MDLTHYVALSPLMISFTVLTYRWLRLRFYRHVYDKGGAEDVEKVARAITPGDNRDLASSKDERHRNAGAATQREEPPEPPKAVPPGQGDEE